MKEVNMEDLLNLWLKKYHNTNYKKVKKDHPEWADAERVFDEMKKHKKDFTEEECTAISERLNNATTEFYKTYAVTEEQHDEWVKEAKEYIRKITKLPKKLIERGWWSVYLDCSPSVKREENDKEENDMP